MTTIRTNPNYADGTPGATDRIIFETSGNLPRGIAPENLLTVANVTGLQAELDDKLDAVDAEAAAGSYIDGLPGTHDATTALLGNNTFGLLNPVQVSAGEITAGTGTALRSFSVANAVAIAQQYGGGGGGLTTALDAGTALTVGTATNGTHRVLTSDSAITLTLDAQATAGMESAFTKAGAGAVSVVMESGAGYWVPSDDIGGSPATTGFTITGYGYLVCIRNTGGNAAEWLFVGQSSLSTRIDGTLTLGAPVIESYLDVGNKTGAASFAFTAAAWQRCIATGNITSMAITSPPAAGVGTLTLEIQQDATGSRTIVWGAAFRFPGGTDHTLSTAANAIDLFVLSTRNGGTNWYVSNPGKNWSP